MLAFIFIPVFGLAGLALYLLPTIIGFRKRNASAIFALNLLLGWTLVGWVVSLVWAFTKEDIPGVAVSPAERPPANVVWTCPTCRGVVASNAPFCQGCGMKMAWPGAVNRLNY